MTGNSMTRETIAAAPTVLRRIEAYKRDEVAERRRVTPLAALEAQTRANPPARGFLAALERRSAAVGVALIAEVKKASPSKGVIRADFDPAALALAYARGGATCLSVLTDGPSFQGADDHLIAARAACALPVIRKDFVHDPYQVVEARALGADCVLLILASLSDAQAAELEAAAFEQGLDVLLETHDEAELERALLLRSRLIGVNNRDLHSFETRLETTERLAPRVPSERLLVAESGIFTPADLARMAAAGARAALIGESLMREPDVEAATRRLLDGVAAGPAR